MLGLILVSMFCFYMASTENVIENDEPLDISKATVEQISENKFIDVKITSTVCQLNKEKTLFDFDNDEYYYLHCSSLYGSGNGIHALTNIP